MIIGPDDSARKPAQHLFPTLSLRKKYIPQEGIENKSGPIIIAPLNSAIPALKSLSRLNYLLLRRFF